jgi:hypothetical protein
MVPPLRIAAIQISPAMRAARIGNQKAASGPAMRVARSRMKPPVPRRSSIIWANRPAIRKKLVIRKR